jgi:transposase
VPFFGVNISPEELKAKFELIMNDNRNAGIVRQLREREEERVCALEAEDMTRVEELMLKQSEKDIANRLDISVSKIDRKLNDISSHTVLKHSILPSSMNWDEFKATKDTKGKMAFLIVDNNKGNIFDILDSRKSRDLEKYFRRYPRYVRDKVRFISIDFYSGYIFLAKKLFKKAKVVIDPFHIVTQCYVALNSTRISLCKKNNIHYNKLKDL